ncbi:MAG: NADPH-dependent F420 reductase [Terriglobales bacterium]
MITTVAIIGGTGPEGRGLAARWARAGLRVIIGSRDENRARMAAQEICTLAGAGAVVDGRENSAAVQETTTVVLAVPFEAQASTLKSLRNAFRPGTVLVCATVPLATSVGDRGTRVLGVWQGSAAEQAVEFLPQGVSIVGAFQNISAALLNTNLPVDSDVIVCTDDAGAKEVAYELVRKIPGARPLDGGKLENARIVEQLTALLINLNIRHKSHGAGLRITGIEEP